MNPITYSHNHYQGCHCEENRGAYYVGTKTVKERGFKVGLVVSIGASYSQPSGTIVGLNDEFPHKAQVKLQNPSGSYTICWIDSRYLR